jgi:regulator of sirC expression with transglutaminase-like and TPR domain
MQLDYDTPSPLDYFGALVADDAQFPLLEACASVAQDEYPELDLQQVLSDVDQIASRLKRRLAADASPVQKLRALNQLFYGELGFAPALNNFYDPDNSFVHLVLGKRQGIPISLAVIWLELAQGLGLSAKGVSFPGHFLVKVSLPMGQVVMDPINGKSLGKEELSERLEPFRRRSGLIDEFEMPLGLYLQAATGREIITRMLRNLKEIHAAASDAPRLLGVLHRLLTLNPKSWPDLRDRGLAHAACGDANAAVLDLQAYLANEEDAFDLDLIAEKLATLKGATR